MELAKMKADRAVDPLINVLANDPSPAVRDAAARGARTDRQPARR